MVYTVTDDPACYPGTDILRNKANIKDADELQKFELAMFITRFEEDWPVGELNYEYYRALHHHLFQDVYDWAGQVRKIRTGKSGHWFCYPEHIDQEMERTFAELETENWHRGMKRDEFISKAAHFLAEVNAVHPFREGNGRAQMALLVLLTESSGFSFDDDKLNADTVLDAMIASFKGNEEPLVNMLRMLVLQK